VLASSRNFGQGFAVYDETMSGVELNRRIRERTAEPLTEREVEVLRIVAQGKSNQEIAEELVLSKATVRTHVKNVYGKLQVHKRSQAIAKARELKLL